MRLLAILLICLPPAWADEGMWPFNQFPKEAVAQKHKFDVSADFLDRLRMASVRLTGGSGSFVSPNGLVLTNQHLTAGCLSQQVSAARSGTVKRVSNVPILPLTFSRTRNFGDSVRAPV
jgi:S1-C subfamily serine protease